MPTDKAGKYHLNTQRAMASDRMAQQPVTMAPPASPQAPAPVQQMAPESAGGEIKITPTGDGGYTTECNGDVQVHASLEEALGYIQQQEGGDEDDTGDGSPEVAAPNLSGV